MAVIRAENGRGGALSLQNKSIPATKLVVVLIGAISGALATWYRDGGPVFQYLLTSAGALLLLDTALGITTALAIRREKLASTKIRRLPMKMIQYSVLVIFAYLMDTLYATSGGHKEHIYIIQIAALFSVVLHEATSVLEHLKDLEPLTGFKVPGFIASKLDQLAKLPIADPVMEVETTITERTVTRVMNDPKKSQPVVPRNADGETLVSAEAPAPFTSEQPVVVEGLMQGTVVGVVKPADPPTGLTITSEKEQGKEQTK